MIKHCFYLNLERRSDRRNHIESELNKSNVLKKIYQRVSGIDGSTIHPRYIEPEILSSNAVDDVLSETATAWGLSVTQGGLGVILSYLKLFRTIQDLDSNVITFEDDVNLDENFDNKLEKIISELPEDFDLCYLGYGEIPVGLKDYSEHLSIPTGRVVCLPGLIVSPSGARKIISILKNLDNQIDTMLATNFNKLNVFVVKDRIVHIPNRLGSDIQGDLNCRKKYQKQNYIFTTLAIGSNAAKNATLLARDLKYFDQKLLVVTDLPELFEPFQNVIIIEHRPKKFSYNDKTICIEGGLKLMDAVVFVDADCRILYNSYKNTSSELSLIISPGFHPSWNWGRISRPGNKFFQSEDVVGRVSGYGELTLELCKQLEIDYDKAHHYQEGIIIVSKENGKENVFLNTWKALANKLDAHDIKNNANRIGIGEGNLIGLAFVKSGLTLNSTDACNIIGQNIKYNFYGQNAVDQMARFPSRKIVVSSTLKEVASNTVMVDFKDKKVKLEWTLSEADEETYMVVFKWNQNNAVEFLDHEFKVNDRVFHFQSEKTGEFFFKKPLSLEINHTPDWYGEKNWEKLI